MSSQLSFLLPEQKEVPSKNNIIIFKKEITEQKIKPSKNRNIVHSDNWKTPQWFYDELNKEFNFDFDPCPYSEGEPLFDGLAIEWKQRNFINPPYSRQLKEKFVLKALEESKKGKLCVLLLPVSTSTKLFHEIILKNISEPIRFVKGRLKFEGYNTKGEYVINSTGMHDSMVVIFDGRK